MASGNLSFLNWLTAVPAVFSFDDLHLAGLFRPRVIRRLVRRLADTSSGGEVEEAEKKQVATDVPPPIEQRRWEPGVKPTSDGIGEESYSRSSGSGAGSGSSCGPPALARAQSTLQWSSESEDEADDANGATSDGGKVKYAGGGANGGGDGDAKSMLCAVVPAVLADNDGGSCGQPRETFDGVLRFRNRGGQVASKSPSPWLPLTSKGPVAGAADRIGSAVVTSRRAPSAGLDDDPVRGEKEGGDSRARAEQAPPVAAGRVVRGARRVMRWAADGLLVILVIKGSVPVVKNMAGVGGGQRMNQTFDRCVLIPSGLS